MELHTLLHSKTLFLWVYTTKGKYISHKNADVFVFTKNFITGLLSLNLQVKHKC